MYGLLRTIHTYVRQRWRWRSPDKVSTNETRTNQPINHDTITAGIERNKKAQCVCGVLLSSNKCHREIKKEEEKEKSPDGGLGIKTNYANSLIL